MEKATNDKVEPQNDKVEPQKVEEAPKVAQQSERRNVRFELSKRPVARCSLV